MGCLCYSTRTLQHGCKRAERGRRRLWAVVSRALASGFAQANHVAQRFPRLRVFTCELIALCLLEADCIALPLSRTLALHLALLLARIVAILLDEI